MKHKEVEYKYNSSGIQLSKFHHFCLEMEPLNYKEVSGTDQFYQNKSMPDRFYRYRVANADDMELTLKIVSDSGNVIRDEHNISLKHMSSSAIGAYVKASGFEYSGEIFKNCFIYTYDYFILVYYICYNTNMQESGRFIEIEMREDYPWHSVEEAKQELDTREKLCKNLGIGPDSRESRSLFEMFGRTVK